jgi:alpha-tubulin suppressor-like RCC1 family protein
VVSLAGVLAVAGGYESSCALLDDGTLRCWGNNANGELGDGTTRDRSSPVAVAGLSHAIAVSAGMVQTCALLDSGGIRCWGGNSYGQLGDGTTTDSPTPVNVAGTP